MSTFVAQWLASTTSKFAPRDRFLGGENTNLLFVWCGGSFVKERCRKRQEA